MGSAPTSADPAHHVRLPPTLSRRLRTVESSSTAAARPTFSAGCARPPRGLRMPELMSQVLWSRARGRERRDDRRGLRRLRHVRRRHLRHAPRPDPLRQHACPRRNITHRTPGPPRVLDRGHLSGRPRLTRRLRSKPHPDPDARRDVPKPVLAALPTIATCSCASASTDRCSTSTRAPVSSPRNCPAGPSRSTPGSSSRPCEPSTQSRANWSERSDGDSGGPGYMSTPHGAEKGSPWPTLSPQQTQTRPSLSLRRECWSTARTSQGRVVPTRPWSRYLPSCSGSFTRTPPRSLAWDPLAGEHVVLGSSTYDAGDPDRAGRAVRQDRPLPADARRSIDHCGSADLPYDYRQTELYQEVLRPAGFGDGMSTCLFAGGRRLCRNVAHVR